MASEMATVDYSVAASDRKPSRGKRQDKDRNVNDERDEDRDEGRHVVD